MRTDILRKIGLSERVIHYGYLIVKHGLYYTVSVCESQYKVNG